MLLKNIECNLTYGNKYNKKCIDNKNNHLKITIGRKYEIQECFPENYADYYWLVTNDDGELELVNNKRF